jgi:AhpC/TSA family
MRNPIMVKLEKVVAVLAILFVFITTASAQQDLSFTTATGQTVSIASMRGKVLVLLFSGAQDPQRREGLKALESLAQRHQSKDVNVCWVSVNAPTEMSDAQLGSTSASAPHVTILRDANQSAFKRLSGKLAQLPTIVVLDRQGNPAGQPRGGFNPNSDFINELAGTIDGLLRQ